MLLGPKDSGLAILPAQKPVLPMPFEMLPCRPVGRIGRQGFLGQGAVFGEFEEAEQEQGLEQGGASGAVDVPRTTAQALKSLT